MQDIFSFSSLLCGSLHFIEIIQLNETMCFQWTFLAQKYVANALLIYLHKPVQQCSVTLIPFDSLLFLDWLCIFRDSVSMPDQYCNSYIIFLYGGKFRYLLEKLQNLYLPLLPHHSYRFDQCRTLTPFKSFLKSIIYLLHGPSNTGAVGISGCIEVMEFMQEQCTCKATLQSIH